MLTDPDEHRARLLSLIPRDARLEDPRSDALIAEGGPAWELWERLAGTNQYPGKPDGSGPVVALRATEGRPLLPGSAGRGPAGGQRGLLRSVGPSPQHGGDR
ncbi:hypothetical protein [Streptomyces sp. McG3]|uniref:hypothetical protein n=1 Tax=Streptomyces sp. McG3 TaxID=2725483 RepID=UPI0035A96E25